MLLFLHYFTLLLLVFTLFYIIIIICYIVNIIIIINFTLYTLLLLGGGIGGGMPGLPIADLSRPPPGFQLPVQGETIPTAPYFDLPAGLMVPLIKFDESGYKPLDPDRIRLPPPQPPSDRLLAAVEYFYSPPSHDRPRDPEGWERLALYEWNREKQFAIRMKQEDIKVKL